MKDLSKYIDHTNLKPEATSQDIIKLCEEAKEHGFYSVCVNSTYVPLCKKSLSGSDVKVCSVVGFPLGAMATDAKFDEAEYAYSCGADEVDMVINIGAVKEGDFSKVADDIFRISTCAYEYEGILKVILETCLLTDDEIKKVCEISLESGAHFVKTSTGFNTGGATEAHVRLMKECVGNEAQVKASGGIRNKETALKMIAAGATRLGTSASIEIIK
ncbi:MAG: deoxyribose-phosphate aldolase [Anaerovoracaceae bacterium]